MTDRDAFIRNILADPADDTPRLVFADWLAENGEPERAATLREPGRWECGCIGEDDAWPLFWRARGWSKAIASVSGKLPGIGCCSTRDEPYVFVRGRWTCMHCYLFGR